MQIFLEYHCMQIDGRKPLINDWISFYVRGMHSRNRIFCNTLMQSYLFMAFVSGLLAAAGSCSTATGNTSCNPGWVSSMRVLFCY